MKLIAIETSTLHGSLTAAQSDDGGAWRVVASHDLPADRRTAQALAPALADLLAELDWKAPELDAVAATKGPGSFTGLRIGVTAAKTLAYAAGAQAVGVNTLAVIARQWFAYPQCDHAPRTHVVLDAHRSEFFAATFEYPPTGDKQPPEVRVVRQADWPATLADRDAVSGPGVSLVADKLPDGVVVAPEKEWRPRADTLALLAGEAVNAGHGVEPWRLLPDYYRLSAAEEKAAAQAQAQQ